MLDGPPCEPGTRRERLIGTCSANHLAFGCLAILDKPILPMPFQPRSYNPEDLQPILAGRPDAQVLGAESRKDGKIYLFVYDGRTKRLADNLVDCDDCSKDKDALATRVQNETAALLDRCFALQCADPSARAPGTEPPVEVCQPFPEAACAVSDKLMVSAAPDATVGSSGYVIDPSTAKLTKGLTWGAFAVTSPQSCYSASMVR